MVKLDVPPVITTKVEKQVVVSIKDSRSSKVPCAGFTNIDEYELDPRAGYAVIASGATTGHPDPGRVGEDEAFVLGELIEAEAVAPGPGDLEVLVLLAGVATERETDDGRTPTRGAGAVFVLDAAAKPAIELLLWSADDS